MDSKVVAFELQDDTAVKRKSVSLTFPRQNNGCLYLITTQKSRCHFCQDPDEKQSFKKTPCTGTDREEEKIIFQYGCSSKVFSVTDSTGSQWEVRLLLSPSEISRLSTAFNLNGCFYVYLPSKEFRQAFNELLQGKKREAAAEKICKAIAPFLCLPDGDLVNDFLTQLRRIVKETSIESMQLSGEEAIMVAGGLTVLQAAELAASLGGSNTFDYRGEKNEGQENLNDQIQPMVEAFNIQMEQLAVSHRGKKVHILIRNPCTDNWASGGRKSIATGETFEFGLCHKVFSISELRCEIQLLQSLQESFDMIAVFHIAAFAKQILMTKKWRKLLEDLLMGGHKPKTIDDLAQLALQFVCSVQCDPRVFLKIFVKELTETLSKVQPLPVGGEVVGVCGLLVATMAALKAKAVADKKIDGDTEQPVVLNDKPTEGAPNCDKIGLPNTQEVSKPMTETIDPNLEENGTDNDAANGNVGGLSRGIADGLENERVERSEKADVERGSFRTHGVGGPDTGTSSPCPQDDASNPEVERHNQNAYAKTNCPWIFGNIDRFGRLESSVDPLPAAEPQCLLESPSIVTTLADCNDSGQEPDEGHGYCPSSSVDVINCEIPVGHVDDPASGQWTARATNEAYISLSMSPKLESSSKDTQGTINHDKQTLDCSGNEPSTFNSQSDPSPKNSNVDQPVHPLPVVHGGEDTSHRVVEPSSFSVPLIILIVAMIVASMMLPSQVTSILFTGVVLLLTANLILSRRL